METMVNEIETLINEAKTLIAEKKYSQAIPTVFRCQKHVPGTFSVFLWNNCF